jgi:hypothetical protein
MAHDSLSLIVLTVDARTKKVRAMRYKSAQIQGFLREGFFSYTEYEPKVKPEKWGRQLDQVNHRRASAT